MTIEYNPTVLVCRSIKDRHELWGLTAKDGARWFVLIGTTLRPQNFRNRVVVS